MVQPGMVYISHPTEYGSLYTLSEVEAIRAVCNTYGLPLYIDGARLGYALAAKENELTLQDLARLSDAFYIGGTKVGALLGEAIVFPKGMDKLFPTHAKRQGAMLAKGFVPAIQFSELFTDHLYERLGRHGIDMAMELKRACWKKATPSTSTPIRTSSLSSFRKKWSKPSGKTSILRSGNARMRTPSSCAL